MIDPATILVHIIGVRIYRKIIVRERQARRRQRERSVLQNFPGDWMNAVLRNDVAGKGWISRVLRIFQRCCYTQGGEVPLPERLGGYLLKTRELLPAADAFVCQEKKCPVVDDRSTQRSYKLIAEKRRLRAVFLHIDDVFSVMYIV